MYNDIVSFHEQSFANIGLFQPRVYFGKQSLFLDN